MKSLRASLFGAAAGLLLLGGAPAGAQEPMSEAEVSGFFDSMDQELTGMVQSGDFEGLMTWMQDAVAEEATFHASVETYAGEERKSFNVFVLDKADMSQLGQIAVGVMTGMQGAQQAIDDYSLDIEVREVIPVGPDAATVTTHITETATFTMPQGATESAAAAEDDGADPEATGSAGTDAGEARSISVEATADCEHFIRRAQAGDALQIGLTACQATMRF